MENNTIKVGSPLMYKMNLDLESPIKNNNFLSNKKKIN